MAKASKVSPPAVVGRMYKAKSKTGSFPSGTPDFGFEYTTPKPYCEVKRLKQGRCATQLNFIKGQTVLRLCGKYGEPGKVVPVNSPEDASAKAAKFCKTVVGGRAEMEPETDSEPEMEPEREGLGDVRWMAEAARQSLQKRSDDVLAGWPKAPLARRQRPSPRPRSSGRTMLWLLGGTAVGLLALRMRGDDNV